jgi:MFS family permease
MSARNQILFMLAIVVAEITSAFEITMIISAMKSLIQVFGSPVAVGWMITIFLITSAMAAAIIGRLGDLFGRRAIMIIVLIVAGAGSFLSAASSELWLVIVGRALQGASGAVLPLVYGLIREHLPAPRVPLFVGIAAGSSAVAGGAGLMLGGYLADQFPWNAIFLCSGFAAVLSVLAVLAFIPRSHVSPPEPQELDLVGGLLFAPVVLGLLLAISNEKMWGGWTSLPVIGLILGSLLLLLIWVRHELRHPRPLIDVRLLADRRVALANGAMMLFACCGLQMAIIQANLLQQPLLTGVGFGLSATLAGLIQVPPNFIALVTGPLGGFISARFGGRTGMILALLLLVGGATIMLVNLSTLAIVIVGIVITGAGITLFVATQPNVIIDVVPSSRTSEATGMIMVMRAAFQALGTQIVIALLASEPVSLEGATWASRAAFEKTFLYVIACAAAALVLTLALPRKPRRSPARTAADA